eukprot:CAMPEP_0179173356 /NCGR_PEP_ID=MMETSP0796-20121207/85543_1 /TAXON_ID=73915 /ORGANISM="Pyrodinium bahamense, Strain pbaha01" /LENGTH=30 /DNA_ID= /DNA_START= /DNA_END= /DNA_ORIENTATION=
MSMSSGLRRVQTSSTLACAVTPHNHNVRPK